MASRRLISVLLFLCACAAAILVAHDADATQVPGRRMGH
jgi:hypothetical protein